MKLEQTSDYSKFVENDEQRPIIDSHVKKIAKSMARNGFIPSKPIQCYAKSGKLVIVDGHHRFAAARASKTPVFYVVEPKECQTIMGEENLLVKKWTILDFARLYATRGNSNYIALMKYYDKGIPISMAASMLSGEGAGSQNVSHLVQNGSFVVKTVECIEFLCTVIDQIGESNCSVKSRMFITALSKCIRCSIFDYDVFLGKAIKHGHLLKKTQNEDEMLDLIEMVYNYKSQTKVPLKFVAQSESRARKVQFGK